VRAARPAGPPAPARRGGAAAVVCGDRLHPHALAFGVPRLGSTAARRRDAVPGALHREVPARHELLEARCDGTTEAERGFDSTSDRRKAVHRLDAPRELHALGKGTSVVDEARDVRCGAPFSATAVATATVVVRVERAPIAAPVASLTRRRRLDPLPHDFDRRLAELLEHVGVEALVRREALERAVIEAGVPTTAIDPVEVLGALDVRRALGRSGGRPVGRDFVGHADSYCGTCASPRRNATTRQREVGSFLPVRGGSRNDRSD